MENDIQKPEEKRKNGFLLPLSILLSTFILAGAWIYTTGLKTAKVGQRPLAAANVQQSLLEGKLLPSQGIVLPVRWGDSGAKLVKAGVIDGGKFESLYNRQGEESKRSLFSASEPIDEAEASYANRSVSLNELRRLLYGEDNGNLKITRENSGIIVNLLWALGLGNKNAILERGPMADPRYITANFASTGGWTIAKGSAMEHYSKHEFVTLTPEQQALVERVSQNIYRPCCDNATYFPDCNHGMAMLGLLELMASQGVSEEEMYRAALKVNSFWFPDVYLTIAKYFESKGIDWSQTDSKEVLSYNFSSASGYQRILSQVAPPEINSSSGCGV